MLREPPCAETEETLFRMANELVTHPIYSPKGLYLRLANLYRYNPPLFVCILVLAVGGVAFFTLVGIDAIKKLLITSPTDVYELVSDVALRRGTAQLPSLASSSSSSSSLDASHATISSYAEPASSSLQLSIPSVPAHQSSSIFASTTGSTYFSHREITLNSDVKDDIPLQSSSWCMPCSFL